MEVLYGHAPLLAELGAGDVRMHGGQQANRSSPSRSSTSAGALSKCFPTASPSSPTTLSSPRRSTSTARQQQLDRGHKLWNEAGESEEAYDHALHVISEAEAKLATAAEKR